MNGLVLKEFHGSRVRMHIDSDGNPWFSAKDVCEVLGLTNSREAVRRLDNEEKVSVLLDGSQKQTVVSESGLYTIVLRSNKESALKFQKWVTKEVLPSIRKTGMYAAGNGEWLTARTQGKVVRKITTDIIQTFIDYAKGQGSQSADKYFMNFTKMVNTALLEIQGEKPRNVRDSLNVIQLHQLSVAETIITRSIMECIGKQLPYKEIYQVAKAKIEAYSQTVGKTRIGQSERQTMGLLA